MSRSRKRSVAYRFRRFVRKHGPILEENRASRRLRERLEATQEVNPVQPS